MRCHSCPIMPSVYTLQCHGVAQAGYACGVAWTGRVMQCTVTACTLLWLVATRNTAHSFGGSMPFKLGRGSRRPTECSWADNLHLSWQLSWQVAAELTADFTNCSWADSWVDKLQLSWQLSWQVAAELTNCTWADSWVDNLKMSWADKLQLSWHCSQADSSRLK